MQRSWFHALLLVAVASPSAEVLPTAAPLPDAASATSRGVEPERPEVAQDTIVVRVGETSSSTITPGTQVTLPILVDPTESGTNVASIGVRVTWATDTMTYVSAVAGDFGSVTLNETDTAGGTLRANSFAAQGTTAAFTVLELTLESSGSQGTTTVRVEVEAIGDELGQSLISQVSTVSHELTIAESPDLWGDPSMDGAITALDALMCLSEVVGRALPPGADATACDVVPDGPSGTFTGLVTSLDALAVLVGQGFKLINITIKVNFIEDAKMISVRIQIREDLIAGWIFRIGLWHRPIQQFIRLFRKLQMQ